VFHATALNSGESSNNPVVEVLQTGRAVGTSDDVLLIKKDGAKCRISKIASPIRDADGRLEGAVLVFRDVTKQRSMEEELRQIERLNSVGELAGGIAHNFNNMLEGIVGMAEILYYEASSESDGYQKQHLQTIIDTAIRASELNKKLLAFAGRSEIFLEPFDTHIAIQKALDILNSTIDQRIRLVTQLEAGESFVSGDLSQFQVAILNLGINAKNALPQGGKISVSTYNVDLDEEYCKASPFELTPGRYIRVKVSDNGVGIRPEIQKRIFEPFFTTKEQGKNVGLGLTAVYGTVLNHKGAITVKSAPGAGTDFHLFLPVVSAPQAPLEVPPGLELQMASGCVLVIEDEELLRSVAQEMLTILGYEVILAENGAEGVSLFQQNRDRIDAVVLDIMMPIMDGYECFRELRKIDPHVRVLISSGYAHSNSELDALRLHGVEAVVPKPYRFSELSRALASVVSKPRGNLEHDDPV
ncbi:MAG: response regulator, partial [Desulforhabdus sp.]|nr:response regulator [Desulforhabdus sp.]